MSRAVAIPCCEQGSGASTWSKADLTGLVFLHCRMGKRGFKVWKALYMEERYEIRGKLGQGGLGAVYRAWDHALKREVAVKRIVSGDDAEHREEATKQMEKETGALAALQHPN
ncbi:MAG: hypothetical protein EOP87_26240, partial [Verrucomicrobiaceae bacterium]